MICSSQFITTIPIKVANKVMKGSGIPGYNVAYATKIRVGKNLKSLIVIENYSLLTKQTIHNENMNDVSITCIYYTCVK